MCLLYPSSRASSCCGKSGRGDPIVSPHAVDVDFDLEIDLDFDFDLEIDLEIEDIRIGS